MKINYKQIFKILSKIIISIIISWLFVVLAIGTYTITQVAINPLMLIIFIILFVLYINWAIWTKGILKQTIMLIVLFAIFIYGVLWGFDYMNIQSDYCIEDGDCKEGRIININNNEILINKESCVENNWQWDEKGKICKITNARFKVKEVVYD